MTYGPGFGLPDLMSPTSELRQAVADLEAAPSNPLRDVQLGGLRQTLKDREADEAAGRPVGFYASTP